VKRVWRSLALVASLMFTGCSVVSGSGEDPFGATVQVQASDVLVSSGSRDILSGTLFVWGLDLRVNEPTCRVVTEHLECPIPPMPALKNYVLPVAGRNLVAQALVERPGGSHLWARKVGLK
jgi:predicted small secreted protein